MTLNKEPKIKFLRHFEWLSGLRAKDINDIERLRRLKQIAGDNKNYRQSLDYRVLETRAERWNGAKFSDMFFEFFFQKLSNYGRSEARVICWLSVNFLAFAGIYYWLAGIEGWSKDKFYSALAYSGSQLLAFIPISRTNRSESADALFNNDLGTPFDLPLSVIATATGQSLISVLLLFRFGLAIRNRFKI